MHKLITHKSHNGSNKVFLLNINGSQKHHIQSWESFELGQKLGLWGEPETIEDVPVDENIIEGVAFTMSSGFKFQANPLDKLVCTQKFGERPEFYKRWQMDGHNGIDFRTKFDDTPDGKRPVYAVMDGMVSKAVPIEDISGYGKYIKLIHDNDYETVYAHLDSLNVLKGQKVSAGDQIGISDATGVGSAAHLHFGLRKLDENGKVLNLNNGFKGSIDPIDYFVGDMKSV